VISGALAFKHEEVTRLRRKRHLRQSDLFQTSYMTAFNSISLRPFLRQARPEQGLSIRYHNSERRSGNARASEVCKGEISFARRKCSIKFSAPAFPGAKHDSVT